MQTSSIEPVAETSPSDQALQRIVEQGFFGSPGSLAKARAACAELIGARATIEAQTARIAELERAAASVDKRRSPRQMAAEV